MSLIETTFNQTVIHLTQIPVKESSTPNRVLAWVSTFIFNLFGISTGFYPYLTQCKDLKSINGFNQLSSSACLTFSVITSLFFTGIFDILLAGIMEMNPSIAKTNLFDNYEMDIYNSKHFVNLTDWHLMLRTNGINTNILYTSNSVYYTEGLNYYAINAISILNFANEDKNIYLQHGMNVSRVFTEIAKNSANYKLEFSFCHAKSHLELPALGINKLINHSYENEDAADSEIYQSHEEIYDLTEKWDEYSI
jgi:hypothetical protein